MTSTATDEVRSLNRWRNRPGRDLLIAIAILYLGATVFAFWTSGGDLSGSLTAPLLLAMTLPMGLAHALMIPRWTTLLALAIPVALIAILIVRMPGYIRVPLLVALGAASIYVTWQMGIVVS